jgi:hypothetical protein
MIVKFDDAVGRSNCNSMKLSVAQCSMENCVIMSALQVFTSECIVVIRVNVSVSCVSV